MNVDDASGFSSTSNIGRSLTLSGPAKSRAMSRRLYKLSPVVPLCFLVGCAIPDEQEIKVIQATPRLEKDLGGVYGDQAVQRYVADVGWQIARCTGRADLSWEFKVLDSRQINAFALPTAKVYITRGLLSRLENEAQLASILGHEVAHVVRGHPTQQLERARALQDGQIMSAIVGGSGAADQINPFVAGLRRYSREQEKEADLYGLNYLARAGYDPQAMVRTMEILEDPPAASAGMLATHPTSENRRQYLQDEIDRRYGGSSRGKLNAEQFQRIVLRY